MAVLGGATVSYERGASAPGKGFGGQGVGQQREMKGARASERDGGRERDRAVFAFCCGVLAAMLRRTGLDGAGDPELAPGEPRP